MVRITPLERILFEALSNLYCTGDAVSVKNEAVATASYYLDEEERMYKDHSVFAMQCRSKDMYLFNQRLSEAKEILDREEELFLDDDNLRRIEAMGARK